MINARRIPVLETLRKPCSSSKCSSTVRLGSLLREGRSELPILESAEFEPALVERAIDHRVVSLVRHHLKANGTWNKVALPLRHAIDEQARKQSLLEL